MPQGDARLRGDAEVAEVADRGAARLAAALHDDHAQPAAHGSERGPESDDPRSDDGDVEVLAGPAHRNTRRIHTATPSTVSTVTRIMSRIEVTIW